MNTVPLGQELPGGLELRFHPDEEYFPTWYITSERADIEHPCFVNKGTHEFADEQVYDCVGYQFYFEFNPATGLGGIFPESEALGHHRHDVEGIYVLFDENKQPQHVYFKAHGLGQGMWMTWDECSFSDGALVVYFSWRSHATYPNPGTVNRIYNFANDINSDGGRAIRIMPKDCMDANEWQHDFGNGIRIWNTIPLISNTSISDQERRRLAFTQDNVRNRARTQYDEEA